MARKMLEEAELARIRRDTEVYLQNNRSLSPNSLSAETIIRLLDTIEGWKGIVQVLVYTTSDNLYRQSIKIESEEYIVENPDFIFPAPAAKVPEPVRDLEVPQPSEPEPPRELQQDSGVPEQGGESTREDRLDNFDGYPF